MTLTVAGLAVYPVKSLRGIALQTLELDRRGPVGDRRFLLADSAGTFVTQREHPRLCLVAIEPCDDGWLLSAPGKPPLRLASGAPAALRRDVTIWRDTVAACDMGDEVAAWFSAYLDTAVRLFHMPDDSLRPVDPVYLPSAAAAARNGDIVGFADGFPLLLIGAASLAEFNRALPTPIGAERFRPNIVVDGAAPYAEDAWRRLRIGDVEFAIVKPCARCAIPSIDPASGRREPIVAQTLARLRRRGDAVYFGQNMIHRALGAIRVGAEVTVLE
jgi:uncharacterized protein YcbX